MRDLSDYEIEQVFGGEGEEVELEEVVVSAYRLNDSGAEMPMRVSELSAYSALKKFFGLSEQNARAGLLEDRRYKCIQMNNGNTLCYSPDNTQVCTIYADGTQSCAPWQNPRTPKPDANTNY